MSEKAFAPEAPSAADATEAKSQTAKAVAEATREAAANATFAPQPAERPEDAFSAPAMPHPKQRDSKHIELQQENANMSEKALAPEAPSAADATEAKPQTTEAVAEATGEAAANATPAPKPEERLEDACSAPAMPHPEQQASKHIELQQESANMSEKAFAREVPSAADATEAKPQTTEAVAEATGEAAANATLTPKPEERLEDACSAPAMPHAEQQASKHIELQQENANMSEAAANATPAPKPANRLEDACSAPAIPHPEQQDSKQIELQQNANVSEKAFAPEAPSAADATEAKSQTAKAVAEATCEAAANATFAPKPAHRLEDACSAPAMPHPEQQDSKHIELQQQNAEEQEKERHQGKQQQPRVARQQGLKLPQQLVDVKEELLEEAFVSMPTDLFVMKLSSNAIKDILGHGFRGETKKKGSVSMLLGWHSKLESGTSICFCESGQQGLVAFLATLVEVRPVQTFGDLRSSQAFSAASGIQKQAWRNRVVVEQKTMYNWILKDILVPGDDMQVNVKVQHVMSFEIEDYKREFILDAHRAREDPNCHVFADVAAFSSESKSAFCYTCSKEHEIPTSLDILFTGPSCKDISKCNADSNAFRDCPLSDVCG
eukprot:s1070_g13.t1